MLVRAPRWWYGVSGASQPPRARTVTSLVTLTLAPLPAGPLGWLLLAAALLLLNGSLTFQNVWPTPYVRWEYALSVELAVLVFALAILRPPPASRVRRALAVVWLGLVAGHYLDVTAPGLYGREFNLYWDAPHIGNVAAMLAEAAPPWLVAAALLGGVAAGVVTYAAARLILGWVADAAARPRMRVGLLAASAAIVVLFVVHGGRGSPAGGLFADPVAPVYLRQVRSVAATLGPASTAPAVGSSPGVLETTVDGLSGSDVYLIFVESYGAVAFDNPRLAQTLTPSRLDFEAAAHETGRRVASAYVESPTFGASSWLAHLSLMTGIEVRDQYSYQSLMAQRRDTLTAPFSRAGYRTVALLPGMRQPWPEGAFYRYDSIYGFADLAYNGPRFGWWTIPDQYALAKLDALEGPPSTRAPLFVVFPTSTTHAPFGPVAPYQPRWEQVLTPEAYDPGEVQRILARPPNLENLSEDYARAMSYAFTTFAGYLRARARDSLLLVLVGDHQPPAAVSGPEAPWTVPVHVVAAQPHVIERLLARGFRPGVAPRPPALGAMHELLPMLLDAFARPAHTGHVAVR